MKKLISLLMAMAMVLALASCGAKPAADTQAAASAPAASSTAEASTPAETSAPAAEAGAAAEASTPAEASAAGEVQYDYGDSTLFTKQDMDNAIDLIEAEFDNWEHCEMVRLSYTSDEECNDDNIDWMNSLADEGAEPFTQCIMFVSTFVTDAEADGALEPETEYDHYEWWLARTEGGDWQLMSWGY